jgi:hypothetical protein
MKHEPMHLLSWSSSRAFERHQEHNLKHPGSVDLTTTKQNKEDYLPSWIDMYSATTKLLQRQND